MSCLLNVPVRRMVEVSSELLWASTETRGLSVPSYQGDGQLTLQHHQHTMRVLLCGVLHSCRGPCKYEVRERHQAGRAYHPV